MRLCPAVRRLLRAGRGVSDSWLPTISGRPAKLANRACDPGRAWRRNMSLSRVICLAPMGIDRWPLGRLLCGFHIPSIFWGNYVMTEILFTSLITPAFLLQLIAIKKGTLEGWT